MATLVLVPGAGGNGEYWDRLVPELERRGHDAIDVDIKEDDPALGLPEYADIVEHAIGDRTDVVLVAQSLAGFTAPMVRRRLQMIVLVNAMVPQPGETPGDWWANTEASEARQELDDAEGRTAFDVEAHFLHDLSDEVKAAVYASNPREPSDTPFGQPCEFERWPDVPIKVVVGRDDRFFPAEFQRRVAKDRLGLDVEVIRGGHLVALANPVELADLLVAHAASSGLDPR